MKQPNVKKLREELWTLCKEITRLRYQREDGLWVCYTCDRLIDEKGKAQTGHGIPSSTGGASLRYHLDNLRIQDYYCNINLGGNGGEFYRRLVLEIGQEEVNELYKLKGKIVKADWVWYTNLIHEYEIILETEKDTVRTT